MPRETILQGNPVLQAMRSIPDQRDYYAQLDFTRSLPVTTTRKAWFYPIGRSLYEDDFEDTLFKWTNVGGGTTVRDTTRAHYGNACMKLTTAAGIGGLAQAQKRFVITADQIRTAAGLPTFGYLTIGGFWLQPSDVNFGFVAMRYEVDDGVQRWRNQLKLVRRVGAGLVNTLYYADSGGVDQVLYNGIGATIVDTRDLWTPFVMKIAYLQGTTPQGGYSRYAGARIGDVRVDFPSATIGGQSIASNGNQELEVDIFWECEVAVVTSVGFIDDFFLTDLTTSTQGA